MHEDLANFRRWYKDTLERMYPFRDAGIPIFMIALPLLERFLRGKNSLSPSVDLTNECMDTLVQVFPVLRDRDLARVFWNVYRNGLLHQATLSLQSCSGKRLPVGFLSHDNPSAILLKADGTFWVHPVLFSQTVVRTIEDDFAAFAAEYTGAPPLPRVVAYVPPTEVGAIPPITLGTNAQR